MKKNIILIADDTAIGRNILRSTLEGNYFVIEAMSIKQAIIFLKLNRDVITLALISEAFDYKEFMRINDTFDRKITTCLLIRNLNEDLVKKANEIGINNFISKPFLPEIVLKQVDNILKDNQQESFEKNDLIKGYENMVARNENVEKEAYASCRIDFDKQVIKNETGFLKELIKEKSSSFKTIIEDLSLMLLNYDKQKFIDTFAYKKIKDNFKNNNKTLDVKALFLINGEYKYLELKVLNISNEINGLNTGLFIIEDIEKEYIENQIHQVLYENEYDVVAILDLKTNTIELNKTDDKVSSFENNTTFNPKDFFEIISKNYFDKKEASVFLSKVNIASIKENLEKSSRFDVASFKSENKMTFYQLSFKYLDEYKEKVVFFVENITAKKELDFITDGLNYHGFLNRCYEEVKDSDKKYALVYVNCINYKDIVEYVSVDAIVSFLKSFYDLIKNSFLNPILIGRSSSDNFWLLIDSNTVDFSNLANFNNISLLASNEVFHLNLRFGIYKFERSLRNFKSYDIDTFCERAKIAENSIEKESNINYVIFNDTLRNDFIVKSTILNDIKTAIDRKEIYAVYQPIYDIDGKKIVSAEALLRWNHHQYGEINPGLFVPVIESSGYISKIDISIIKQVNEFLETLEEENIRIPISVNLSRVDFFDSELVNLIKDITISHNKYPYYMNFEVTESYNIDLNNNISSILSELRANNAKVYLDDFGDGVSSFKALISSNFDVLKIYKGLVDAIFKNKISSESVKAICSMARSVGLKIIAEGCENERQQKFLKNCKVDYIQGYIYGKPMNKDEFIRALQKQSKK